MPGFIVFEGLNGSGKSTLVRCLANNLKGVLVNTPPDSLLALRPTIDEHTSLTVKYYYYMLGNAIVSEQVRELRKTQLVLCDRFVHSTIARYRLLGLDVDPAEAIRGMENPDISFFITMSDEAERLQRINSRGKRTKGDDLDSDPVMREKYLEYFRARQFVFFDTNGQTVDESVQALIKKFDSLGINYGTRA